ncbi:hypothetical protein CAPTEDRAFT_193843 [Capitella teleta]|uniref:THAP-type domain-containing protein n=1 Tax=Capitella teleta TaxID=283909 RepID=R7UYS4_CAPTE|nr:hypothetical protein CAPTEDRAFT_193843 [Capitella teleta]|eukprot:ELU11442.1 hypothetical protein CAPTEDRAFT_193843 [Capitella teleta]
MPVCSAFGCQRRPERDRKDGITFHKFPRCPGLRKKWIAATRRENFTPSKFAVLCSCHFLEKDMDRTSLSCVRVREGAIPSVFSALHLQPKPRSNRKHRKDRSETQKNPNRLEDSESERLDIKSEIDSESERLDIKSEIDSESERLDIKSEIDSESERLDIKSEIDSESERLDMNFF